MPTKYIFTFAVSDTEEQRMSYARLFLLIIQVKVL